MTDFFSYPANQTNPPPSSSFLPPWFNPSSSAAQCKPQYDLHHYNYNHNHKSITRIRLGQLHHLNLNSLLDTKAQTRAASTREGDTRIETDGPLVRVVAQTHRPKRYPMI